MASARRTRPAGRPFLQHLAVRWPALGPPLLALWVRFPHLPTRRALTLRVLHDSAAAFTRGDLEAALSGMAPEVAFDLPPGFPDSGTLHGRQAVHDFYAQTLGDWSSAELHYDSLEHVDSKAIVAAWRMRFAGGETNLGFEMHGIQTFEIERGRIVRVHATLDGSRSLDSG
jgi:ketosteroid isomerase-like protein